MKQPVKEPQRFSHYFNLSSNQSELDFLDIYVNQDIPLFLDPYGIAAMGSKWSRDCETQIATYFQFLIDCIKAGDKRNTERLLNALHEVDEVSLGYSMGPPKGRGIGSVQAKEIQNAFENSQAAKSGDIKDIADCALMIPGINRDKISDITANILKRQLVIFTQEQCKLHSIPMQKVAVNNAFDHDKFIFTSYRTELPVINGRAKILLPINSVRHVPELSKDKYYRNFVLEYLRAEHCHAGDSLATVLRTGKVVVRIGDLKNKYPLGVDFLYDFSKAHPTVLEKYKVELRRTSLKSGNSPVLETKRKILSASDRARILADIKPGNVDATNFHKITFDNLIYIFGNRLSNPFREKDINSGRKRIDIVFDNDDESGFFYRLSNIYKVISPKIFIECKNYGKELGNPELDQLLGRFSPNRGKFGIVICRSIKDKTTMVQRCKDALHEGKGCILVLEDKDINELLIHKDNKEEKEIDKFMRSKYDELIM